MRILYNKMRKSVDCYQEIDKQHGWCGTCNPNAQEGERGYCDGEVHEDNHENTIVKTSKNWGFCSDLCSSHDHFTRKLQETKLTILKDEECKVFANDDLLNLEFVAGTAILFRQ